MPFSLRSAPKTATRADREDTKISCLATIRFMNVCRSYLRPYSQHEPAPMELPIVRFNRKPSDFSKTLKERVDAYFKENGLSRQGDWRMYAKTVLMLGLFFTPWAFIAFGGTGGGWQFWVAEIVMGFGLAGIGLNVMHDANHGSFSKHKWVNQTVSYVLDLVGGSSALWRIQHNVLHHSFTNIEGLDEDIDTPGILRFTPNRPLKKIHKLQFIYAWGFYSIMTLFWMTAKDWLALARYRKKGLVKSSGSSVGQLTRDLIISKVAVLRLHHGLAGALQRPPVLENHRGLDGHARRDRTHLGFHLPACSRVGRLAICPRGKRRKHGRRQPLTPTQIHRKLWHTIAPVHVDVWWFESSNRAPLVSASLPHSLQRFGTHRAQDSRRIWASLSLIHHICWRTRLAHQDALEARTRRAVGIIPHGLFGFRA